MTGPQFVTALFVGAGVCVAALLWFAFWKGYHRGHSAGWLEGFSYGEGAAFKVCEDRHAKGTGSK